MADSDSEWTTCDSSSGSESEQGTSLELDNLSIGESSDREEVGAAGFSGVGPRPNDDEPLADEAYLEAFRRQTQERRQRLALLADRFEKRSDISEWYVRFISFIGIGSIQIRFTHVLSA